MRLASAASTGLMLAAVLLAAGCSKPAGNAAPGQATRSGDAAGALAPSAGPPAAGADQLGPVIDVSQLPTPHAGEWQTTETVAGKPAEVSKSCLSGKKPTLRAPKDCQSFTLHRTLLGAIVFDASCSFQGGVAMAVHSVMKGDMTTHYSGDITTTMKMGPNQPPQVEVRHTEAAYVGPCPAGETPDDE